MSLHSYKITFYALFAVISTLLCFRCNIFDFSDSKKDTSFEKAEDCIRLGYYEEAKLVLADALKDSVNSEALYLAAKATILMGGFDIAQIVSQIEVGNPIPGLKLAILELIDELGDGNKTKWFASNREVVTLLRRIYDEKTTGTFTRDDIVIDYTLSNLMTGILKIRDPNHDFTIDYRDFQLDLKYFTKTTGFTKSGYQITGAKIKDMSGSIVVNDQGLPVILGGLTAFAGGWGSQIAGYPDQYKPDGINNWLEHVFSSLTSTDSILSEMLNKKDESTFDVREIKLYNNQIASGLNNYWYDDGIDNDGDGTVDEEVLNGLDDDMDGLVDEDTRYHPSDPTNSRNDQYRITWREWVERIVQETR